MNCSQPESRFATRTEVLSFARFAFREMDRSGQLSITVNVVSKGDVLLLPLIARWTWQRLALAKTRTTEAAARIPRFPITLWFTVFREELKNGWFNSVRLGSVFSPESCDDLSIR